MPPQDETQAVTVPASCAADGTRKVWDTADARSPATFWSDNSEWLAFAPQGHVSASGGVWEKAACKPVADAKQLAPLRAAERVAKSLQGQKLPDPAFGQVRK